MLDCTNKNISKKICENDITHRPPAIIYFGYILCRLVISYEYRDISNLAMTSFFK